MARLSLVAVFVPIFYASAFFVPQFGYIVLAVTVMIFASGSGFELAKLCMPSLSLPKRLAYSFISVMPSLATYLFGLFSDASIMELFFVSASTAVILFLLSALPRAFVVDASTVHDTVNAAGMKAQLLLYVGLLSSTMILILNTGENAGMLMIWFSLVAFANDSLAWLFGITIGRHKGIFKVSPNKSLEGFIAGMCGSVAAALLGPVLFPFVPKEWLILCAMGLVCGVASVTGDLFESALKRSAGVKDSGSLIPGRGGFLDSFDSIMFTAPAFVVFLFLLRLV